MRWCFVDMMFEFSCLFICDDVGVDLMFKFISICICDGAFCGYDV